MGIATKGFSVWWVLDSLSESDGVCFQDVQKEDRGSAKWRIKHDAYVIASNIPASERAIARFKEWRATEVCNLDVRVERVTYNSFINWSCFAVSLIDCSAETNFHGRHSIALFLFKRITFPTEGRIPFN